jgi:adenylate kinase
MKPQLILLGAPGSGKGTQAKSLVTQYGYSHISTGDLLRAEVAKNSQLGSKIKSVMESGNLVNDELVLELLKANCNIDKSSYIFDGFPRNYEQSKALDDLVLGKSKCIALYFEVNIQQIVDRIVNRRNCPKCGKIYNIISLPPKKSGSCDDCGPVELVHRKDDTESVVRNRIKVYEDSISKVLSYYEKKGVLRKIDASQDPNVVYKNIQAILD